MKNSKCLFVLMAVLFSMTVPAVSVFSEENSYSVEISASEYEYTVEFSYYVVKNGKKTNEMKTASKTFLASSAADARAQAISYCTYNYGEVASCGAARATGRKR